MAKKCIICGEKALFQIKNSSETYCKECTQDQFGDVSLLVKVEATGKVLKRYLDNVGKEDPMVENLIEEEEEE